jgi:hypothetical protein
MALMFNVLMVAAIVAIMLTVPKGPTAKAA